MPVAVILAYAIGVHSFTYGVSCREWFPELDVGAPAVSVTVSHFSRLKELFLECSPHLATF